MYRLTLGAAQFCPPTAEAEVAALEAGAETTEAEVETTTLLAEAVAEVVAFVEAE